MVSLYNEHPWTAALLRIVERPHRAVQLLPCGGYIMIIVAILRDSVVNHQIRRENTQHRYDQLLRQPHDGHSSAWRGRSAVRKSTRSIEAHCTYIENNKSNMKRSFTLVHFLLHDSRVSRSGNEYNRVMAFKIALAE